MIWAITPVITGIQMSLIQKLYDAQEEKDLEKYNEVVSEDYY